jgi:hypothetical protein
MVTVDIGELSKGVFGLIDDLFTSDEERAAAKAKLLQQEGQQKLAEMQARLSAIMAEAQSKDPWTSRARPSFLYVMYLLILFAIPMGVVAAFRPDMAILIANGFGAWLDAVPEELYTLMGIGYLGYTGARSWDKRKK